MDSTHSTHLAAAPPPPSVTVQNSNRPAPGRDSSSNLTSGTVPQAQSHPPRPPSPRSLPQHTLITSAPTFRAPAHKNAHYLHSIPPREKSTRTLIIDYLLWVHIVTRFAQARAELAMTDRTGGPGTPNYAHRERPEQWDENEMVASEGEQDDADGRAPPARSRGPDHVDDKDGKKVPGMTARQDLPFARSLRKRAESLENVVTGMLEQPPRDIPFPEEEPIASTSLLQQSPPVTPSPVRKHVLPNGVRLRLALTTMINDLFARQVPVHHHSHFQGAVPAASPPVSGSDSSASSSPKMTPPTSVSSSASSRASLSRLLPQSLVPLLGVSRTFTTEPSTSSPFPPFASNSISPRVHDMFAGGATHLSTASSTSMPRCPRHLNHPCEICFDPGRGAYTTTRPRGVSHTDSGAPVAQGGGISGLAEGVGIGSGLARSGTRGRTLLRRGTVTASPPPASPPSPPDDDDDSRARSHDSGSVVLVELIPRFVRLSALVTLELRREVGDSEEIGLGSGTGRSRAAVVPTAQWYFLLAGLLTRVALEGYLTAGWRGLVPLQVLLGFGLGAASPHDTADEDDGALPRSPALAAEGLQDKYVEFEPDGMPDLSDAVDVLFPSWRANAGKGREIEDESGGGGKEGRGESSERVGSDRSEDAARFGGGEAEYAREMGQRFARFLDIPASTPDLTTHLEHLTCQYPVEPVERAALRFCEALAHWRGKPELETNKKRSPMPSHNAPSASPPTPPSGVLGGSGVGVGGITNAAVRRAIGRYFVIPPKTRLTTTTTTTAMADAVPADVLGSDGEGDGEVVIGRKRAHAAMSGAAAAASNGGAADRWRERRGYT